MTLLFDLDADPGETKNLSTSHPQIVKALETEYEAWNETLPKDSILPAQRSTVAEMYGENLQLIF